MSGIVFENFGNQVIYHRVGGGFEIIDPYGEGNVPNQVGLQQTPDGGGDMISWNGLVFFNGRNSSGSSDLQVFNLGKSTIDANPPNTRMDYEVGNAAGPGLAPQDFVGSSNELYFVGQTAPDSNGAGGGSRLWETNGNFSATHELPNSPVDDGQMAMLGNNLYFNSGGNLEEYDGSFSTVANGLNPTDTTAAIMQNFTSSSQDLFFNGNGNLYEYSGSGTPNAFGSGLDPRDITQDSWAATGSSGQRIEEAGIVFNGADGHSASNPGRDGGTSGRGLFVLNPTSTGLASSEVYGSGGLNPQDITELDGNIYFAAADTGNPTGPEGLWEFNPGAMQGHQLHEVLSSSQYNLDLNSDGLASTLSGPYAAPQPQIVASGGELDFSALSSNDTSELFAYHPSTGQVTGAAFSNPYNLTATS
jgi:hypothetical protein